MGQLTLSRFRGDTAFSFISRIFSTFMGGVVGMVMWYVLGFRNHGLFEQKAPLYFYRYASTGSGRGNPYGLAAVFVVCAFPFLYARLYLPWNQLTTIVFFVTAMLVSVDFGFFLRFGS